MKYIKQHNLLIKKIKYINFILQDIIYNILVA